MADDAAPTSTATEQPPAAAAPEGQQPPAATFSQADLDRIIRERVERERAKYADYDKLKQAQAELDRIKTAQMSEDEKRQARITELESLAATAQRERDDALAKANERLLRAAVIDEAAKLGFIRADEAYALIDKALLSIGDDGEPLGVAEAVKRLAAERDHLLRKDKPVAPNLNGGASGPTDATLPVLSEEQERVAKRLGITSNTYAKRLAEVQGKLRR